MYEVIEVGNYREFKRALDLEVKQVTDGFIRIGYLLKVARDTEVLKEGGYNSVAEFAQAEYGLTKDIVSRYIAINDRYSEGGYSDKLKTQFEPYGVAKLAEMLTLPDSVIEAMSPELTRKDIQEIKKELNEEKSITELEVVLEGQNQQQMVLNSNLEKVLHQHLHDNPEQYIKLWAAVNETVYKGSSEPVIEKILDAIAPSGISVIITRVQGVGKFMLSIRGKEKDLELLNVREDSKDTISWDGLIETLENLCDTAGGAKASWEQLYEEEFPKKEEVAPVQQKTVQTPIKTESKSKSEKPKVQAITKEEDKTEDNVDNSSESANESEEFEESEEKNSENDVDETVEEQEITESESNVETSEAAVEEKQEERLQDQTDQEKGFKIAEYKKELEKEIESIKTQIAYNQFTNALAASEKLLKSLQAIISLEEE